MENRFWFGDTPREGIFTFPLHHFSAEKLTKKRSYASLYWGMVLAFLMALYLFFSLFQNVQPAHRQVDDFVHHIAAQELNEAYPFLSPEIQQKVSLETFQQELSWLNLNSQQPLDLIQTKTNGHQIILYGSLVHNDGATQPASFTLSKYKNRWQIDQMLLGQDPFSDRFMPELFFNP